MPFFPAPVRALLPICHREAQTFKLFPLGPGSREFLRVVAVERDKRAGICRAGEGWCDFCPLDKQPGRRALGIFGADGEINRLEAKVDIASAVMREKALDGIYSDPVLRSAVELSPHRAMMDK